MVIKTLVLSMQSKEIRVSQTYFHNKKVSY